MGEPMNREPEPPTYHEGGSERLELLAILAIGAVACAVLVLGHQAFEAWVHAQLWGGR